MAEDFAVCGRCGKRIKLLTYSTLDEAWVHIDRGVFDHLATPVPDVVAEVADARNDELRSRLPFIPEARLPFIPEADPPEDDFEYGGLDQWKPGGF